MTEAAGARRRSVLGIARNAAMSAATGVAFVFVVCAGRPNLWSWRLVLWGASGGAVVYGFCHFLDFAVGDPIRKRKLVPDAVVGIPLYFVGGTAGFLATTALLEAAGIMPFQLSAAD